MQLLWFMPTGGDGRYLATGVGGRTTDFPYLEQIAKAVDYLGFAGALLPVGRYCEDPWIAASTLVPVTRHLRFLVALRPGLMSPGVAARMAATLDRFSGGRLLLNVVTGGDPQELGGDGLHLSHDDCYELTDEFLTVWRQVAGGDTTTFNGNYLDIRDGKLMFPPRQTPHPPLWFGGSSAIAQRIAAKHVDTYLTWGEPPAQVAEKIASVRKLAEAEGRSLKFGMRLHVIVRETESAAWDAANELIRYVDNDAIAMAQTALNKNDSVGQQRMVNLHNGDRDALEISPNLWAGIGLVRSGAGTALVGSPDIVAARLLEYHALGIERFILSGYPHLEEAYRVAELLFPRLPLTHHSSLTQQSTSPRGEMVGNFAFPKQASEPKIHLNVD